MEEEEKLKRKEACIRHAKTIHDTLRELYENYTVYYEAWRRRDEKRMEIAARSLEDQVSWIDELYETSLAFGAPEIITREEIEELKDDIRHIVSLMKEGRDPDVVGAFAEITNSRWLVKLWDKYCECLRKMNLI